MKFWPLGLVLALASCSSDSDDPPADPATDDTVAHDTSDTAGDSGPVDTSGGDSSDGSSGDEVDTSVPSDPLTEAGFALTTSGGALSLGPLGAYSGESGAYQSTIATRSTVPSVNFLQGFYTFAEDDADWTAHPVTGDHEAIEAGDATVSVTAVADGTVEVTIRAPEGHNRVSVAFACDPADRFFGFGAMAPRLEHRGHRVPIWLQEQGLGKSEEKLESEFDLTFTGAPYDQYYGVPFFISPRGYGVLVEQTERIVFELCSANKSAWRVEAWSDELKLVLFSGSKPTEVLERATARWGRPPDVVDWALLPWIAVKGGEAHVRDQMQKVLDEGIAASAIWSEDWLGEEISEFTGNNLKYHWEWDPEHYPDLSGLIDDLHSEDLNFLGYFNPFILPKYPEWDQAVENGYLPTKEDGDPYRFTVLLQGEGSVVDLTNEAARAWLLTYLQNARALGLDGWMADYAEWIPWEAHFADGRTGASVSSDYPRLWQQVHREACDPADCVFFVRSGFTGSNAIAPVAWGGDQDTDFGEDDGLPTAVRIGVGLGLTGVAMYGSDIAGYTAFGTEPSTKELYLRWTEAAAFQPVMRTHEGNAGAVVNWHWDRDEETLSHFRRYTELHTLLFPLFKALLAEATRTGVPIMRHPFLHFPDDERAHTTRDTYLLGDSVLVAPVVTEGATERTIGLPAGTEWVHWQTGERFAGGQDITLPAPIGTIPVLVRAGGLVPVLAAPAHRTPEVVAQYASHLAVHVYPGADGAFELADGTTLTLTSSSATDPGEAGLPACASDAQRGCQLVDKGARVYRLDGPTLSATDFEFEASSDSRQWDLIVHGAP